MLTVSGRRGQPLRSWRARILIAMTVTPADDGASGFEAAYDQVRPLYERLIEEVLFALNASCSKAGIRRHSIAGRVKDRKSLLDKGARKGYSDPLAQADDIAGTRVVVLFQSDLPRVREIIESEFQVLSVEDKVEGGDPTEFGYMSIHYIVALSEGHSGPRYDELRKLRCEVQVRTVVMDAWANVSHHLDYKSDQSLPRDLRRDFFALSGLFYVADQHFELFFREATRSRERAEEHVRGDKPAELNADTLAAFLERRYPDRGASWGVSDLVDELVRHGYTTTDQVGRALDRADEAAAALERREPPARTGAEEAAGRTRFSPVGIVRIALAVADAEYCLSQYPDESAKFAALAAEFEVERGSTAG